MPGPVESKHESFLNKKLHFNYLPAYARFLLDERLLQLVTYGLQISRELNFHLLKYFDLMDEPKLIELSKTSNTAFLTAMIDNKLDEYITESTERWKANQLPLISRDQIVAEDIALTSFIRKKAFQKFLPDYTGDVELCLNIVQELDEYTLTQQARGFKTFIDIQQEKLNEVNKNLAILNQSLGQKNIELERNNKELTSFGYVASHDLQEPLRNIRIFINMVVERESENLSEKGKQLLGRITGSTGRMQKLIEDLLTFSRMQAVSDEFGEVDLNEIISEIKGLHSELIDENKMKVTSAKLPVVNGIAFQLHQLLDNLFTNAIKYRRQNVPLNISIRCELINGRDILAEGGDPGKNYFRISVADNGIGFEQKYALRIFEIFQRLHGKDEYSGTGIGLAICKKIVQNHNGFIYAVGVPDAGATIYVCLPV